MSFEQKHVYRIFFEDKLIKSSGDAFQQIFNKLMTIAYDNFVKVEPQGRIGDRKCDGYLKRDGIFYQVYGPKDYNSTADIQKSAINKIDIDFNGLKNHVNNGHWEPIKQFIFVFKTHRGSYPDLIDTCITLERNNPTIEFNIYDIDKLVSIFSSLSLEQMSMIAETYIPNPDFSYINYEVMGDIIKYLRVIGASNNIDITKIPPDFNDKIEFNGICSFYASNLTTASYSIDKLDDYLSSYGNTDISDYLCGIFKTLYTDSIKNYPNDQNLQFKYILEHCRKANTPPEIIQLIETNSYIMMAKYFETCDIFEEPQKNKEL